MRNGSINDNLDQGRQRLDGERLQGDFRLSANDDAAKGNNSSAAGFFGR